MLKSNFSSDLNVEAEVTKFIDQYMYPFLGRAFERQFSMEQQQKGIDVIVDSNGDSLIIDDKCAFYYANKNLRTFTFELSFLNRGTIREGWLLNEDLLTTHYNLMWLNTKNKAIKPRNITCQDILEIEAMIIPKQNIVSYLDALGFDLDTLKKLDSTFRHSNTTRKKLTPHIELIISNQMAEKPINLKVNKTELAKLAIYHLNVTEHQLLDRKTNSILPKQRESLL